MNKLPMLQIGYKVTSSVVAGGEKSWRWEHADGRFAIGFANREAAVNDAIGHGATTMIIDNFHGDYSFLSNFYPCRVKYEGLVYPSAEHAYQAAKSDDPEVRKEIRDLNKASMAKSAGKKIKLRKDWESVKLKVMEDILRRKFSDPELARQLKDTGAAELVEGNTWGDLFWGVCNKQGQNHLGKLLMKIREEIHNEENN